MRMYKLPKSGQSEPGGGQVSGKVAREWAVSATRHVYKSHVQASPARTVALKGKLEGVWTVRWPPGVVLNKTYWSPRYW